MELELGLKVTRTREDVSSSVDFRFSKDPFGPLVLSRETDSRFIIIIHLKGFKKEGIEIEINKEGDKITIRGRKPVEEMVMIRWMAWRKEVEMRAFRKVFLIPNVVDLDKIKARFDDDDATLTITLPKRVKGISGFNLEQEEEEEEEEEECVDFGDVSEVKNREEVEERDESGEHSETEREEGFEEMMEDKERERQLFEGGEEGFSEGVDKDETQIEDDDLEKIQQIDEQELADSDRESEDGDSTKLPDIVEDNQEVMEQKVSEEIKTDDIRSKAVEEIEEQESDEVGRTSISKAMEKEKTDGDDDDDGLRKAQGTEEPERHNEVSNILQEMLEGDPKEDVEAEMGEGFTANIERTRIVSEDDVSETETKAEELESEKTEDDKVDGRENMKEFVEAKTPEAETYIANDVPKTVQETQAPEVDTVVKTDDEGKEKKKSVEMETAPNIAEAETKAEDTESEKVEADEVDKIHKPAEKKEEEEEDANVRAKGEDRRSLIKLQEGEEPHSKGRKRQDKELLEEKEAPQAEKNIVNDVLKPMQENETEVGALGEVMEQKVSEETKSDDNGSGADEETEEQESDEVVGTNKSRETEKKKTDGGDDDDGLRKAQGIEEPERRCEVRKIQEMVGEETGSQEKDAKEKSDGKETQTEDEDLEKSQQIDEEETVGQHEFADSNAESEDSRKPRGILEQEVKKQKDSQEETRSDDFGSKAFEEIQKQEPHEQLDRTSRETVNDDGFRKAQVIREAERHNEVRNLQEMVEGETSDPEKRKKVKMETKSKEPTKQDVDAEMGEGSTPNTERSQVVAEDDAETKAEELESGKPDKKHEEEEEDTKVRRQSEDMIQENEEQQSKGREENIKELMEEKTPEAETNNIADHVPKPEVGSVVKTDDEGKEKMETAPNIAETETKPEDIKSEKVEADEVEKKEEEDANVRAKGEDRRSKFQEDEEQEKNKELLEEKEAPEAEKNNKQEFADSVTESGESSSSLRKPPDMMDQKDSQAETRSDGFGSGAFEGIENQEPCEQQLDATSKSREMADDDDDDGLSNVQGTEVSKIQEMVEGETSDPEKRKKAKMEITSRDSKEEVDDGFTPRIERTQVVAEADKVDKKHELVEKKEEEVDNTKLRSKSEEQRSLTKFQEIEEQHSKGPRRVDKQENIKELVKQKATVAETSIENDFQKHVQETEASEVGSVVKTDDEGKEKKKKKTVEMETETKPEDIESVKVEADEVDKIHKLVEKKDEEVANVRSLIKLQENEEQHSKGRKRQEKQENIKELVEEKAPEAETHMVDSDVPKPVQKMEVPEAGTFGETGDQGKEKKSVAKTETKPEEFESDKLEADEVDKIHKLGEKKEDEDENNNAAEVGTQSEDISSPKIKELVEEKTIENDTPQPVQEEENDDVSRKPQETIRQQELDECERSKTQELVESKTNDQEKEEKETEKTVIKGQDSYRPKVFREEEEEKVQEVADEKTDCSKNRKLKREEEEVTEKETELGDDNISRKAGDSDAKEEEVDAEIGKVFPASIAETETRPEDFESEKQGADEVDKTHKMAEKKEEEFSHVRRKSEDRRRSLVKLQENEEPHSKVRKRQDKQESTKGMVEEKAPEEETNDVPKPVQEIEPEVGTLGETDDAEKEAKEKKKKKSVNLEVRNKDAKEEETDVKIRVPNIAEAEQKPDEFVSDQLKADEDDKIHELVEKKKEEEDDKNGDQQSQGQKQHNRQENIEELLTPQADTDVKDDSPKPVQERCEEGKQKIAKLFQEERKKEPEEHKEKMVERGEKIDDSIRKQELDEENNAKVRRQREDESLTKLQENEKQHSKRQKLQEKTAEKETDIPTPVQETEVAEVDTLETETDTETMEQESYKPKVLEEQEKIHEQADEKAEFGKVKEEEDDDHHHISRKVGDTGQRDSDSKEEFDPEIGNISETEKKADTVKAVEEERMVENKKKKENDKVRRESEEATGLKRLQEEKFQGPNRHSKQEKTNEFQETERPEVETLETCNKDKVFFAETETKDQESYRPKILEGEEEEEDKIQEVAEDKMNVSRKTPDIEQRGSDAMKGQEEKVSDGGKKIVGEAIAENDKSRKVQEIDEHQPHEPGNQVQKLIGGETSGQEEDIEDVESEKKTRAVDKRFKDSVREAQEVKRRDSDDVSEKYDKGDAFQELQEDATTYQNEQETGEKTQKMVDGKREESETITDDVIRKVQGNKEEELSEPKRNHVSKIKQVIKEKTAEAEKEDECGGLSEEQESHERYRTKITETEEASGQEKVVASRRITEKESSLNAQEDKESHEEQYKIQEVVEDVHEETKEDTSKKDQEIESDGLKISVVQDKKQETEEEEEIVERKTKTEDGSLRKVGDDGDPEMSKPYKRQEEDKIQEPVEMGTTSDYKEKVKKLDGSDILRSQEPDKDNLYELERHGEQTYIPQGEGMIQEPVGTRDYSEKVKKQDGDVEEEKAKVEYMAELEGKVEDDSSDKFHEIEERKSYEDFTHEMQEKRKDFGKEEPNDPKESEEQDKTRAVEEKDMVEMRKVQDDEDPELSKPYKSQEEDKIQEPVEMGTTSDYREEDKKQDADDTLRSQELGKPNLVKEEATGSKDNSTAEAGYTDHKEDEQQEKVIAKEELKDEKETSENIQDIEKKKSDESESSMGQDKMQETKEKEENRAVEETKIVERRTRTEDGSLRKVGDGLEPKPSKPYKRRDEDKIKDLVEMETSDYREKIKKQDGNDVSRSQETEKLDVVEEEATGPRDEHTGGKLEPEEEIYDKVSETDETEVEDETSKKVEEEEDSLDDPMTKIQESEKEESHEPEIQEKLDIVEEELERKEASSHDVKLETEEDSHTKCQEKDVEKQEDEEKTEAGVEMQAKIKEGNEKVEEVEMQAKIGIRSMKEQESYELLEDEEHDKIPEPVVEETKYQREEDRKTEEMKRKSDDVSSREVQKIKAEDTDGLEKHRMRHSEQDKKQLVVEKDSSDQETKSRDDSSRKTREQKRTYEEQDKTNVGPDYSKNEENGKEDKEIAEAERSRKSKWIEKHEKQQGSSEPRRDVERDKIPPVDSETSEDDSEELEVEVEDSEEDWEAEVIQEMDSDEDNDKLRKLRRIKLGFRLVGGSTLFMSLIVIVIGLIRSKRKIRCYKF